MNKIYNMSLRPPRDHNDERPTRTSKHPPCTCCPYGYHIDLDFVRYCESLALDTGFAESDSAAYKRRERRRQRQSMEVLLGLINAPTPPPSTFQKYVRPAPPVPERRSVPERNYDTSFNLEDALQDVVSDFEQIYASQNSNTPLSRSYTTKPSHNGVGSFKLNDKIDKPMPVHEKKAKSNDRNETASPDRSQAINYPPTLKTIREQMALSLQRMRDLEIQVSSIPNLQEQIVILKERNRNLISQLSQLERDKTEYQCPRFTAHHQIVSNTHSLPRLRSSSFSDMNSKSVKPKRDASVTCGVITRDIGVGNAALKPTSSSVSIQTIADTPKVSPVTKSTQTIEVRPPFRYSVGVQCDVDEGIALHIAEKRDIGIQAVERKHFNHIGINVKPATHDSNINTTEPSVRNVGVGTASVSLSSVLSPMSRSKSFNMGEEHLNLSKRTRSTASQYTLHNTTQKSTQSDAPPKRSNAACQYELLPSFCLSKGSQSDAVKTAAKSTETMPEVRPVVPKMVEKGVEANLPMPTTSHPKKPDSPIVSRIPRPASFGITPPDARRLKRQQTYTKLEANEMDIKLDVGDVEDSSEKVKEADTPIISENKSPVLQDSTNSPALCPAMDVTTNYTVTEDNAKHRQKVLPSKEMRAAMKVVNDYLLKTSNKNVSQLKNATNIIQQEWFKVSSTVHADPLDIEDYMDCFEEVSSDLLHYVVNMIDNSGNTAMHYAVSHGNFDVVSILLDSKVCNINRPNAAGYTAIMLLSLAEIRSPTHSNVIRKLFQLADVNIKAKQHGQTALMLAVSHGRTDMAALLLEAGADVNIQDEDGSTALMCAAEHGHIEIVRLFLSQSECDSSILDVDGSTALKIALEAGHRDIGVLLYAHERMTSGASPYASLNRRKSARSKPASPKLPRSPMATTPSTPRL